MGEMEKMSKEVPTRSRSDFAHNEASNLEPIRHIVIQC